jgi:2-methylcitrate dehydratase PrpD
MSNLTADLGDFLANVRFESVPSEALPLVRDAFTDTIAVIMVGIDEPVVDIARRTFTQQGASREARACLSSVYVGAPEAALIGGVAAHALDYDDQSLSGHPSAVMVPALLAEGEHLGSTGRELVTAYVAGYEIWAELLRRSSNYHLKGWHPTSVFGTIGAAAATAVLHRLSAERAATALAIAASHSGGLVANFGTMTKPLHAGRAARDGVIAARLAAAGMSAGADALENAQGFLTAFSPDGNADRTSPARVGAEWYLLRQRLCIKKYPTCYFMHRSFDAAVRMLKARQLTADQIAEIEVTMGKGQTNVLANERPQTGLEAKFSEQFAMAAAAILGHMDVEDLTDAVVQRADIQSFFPKVKLNPVDEYDTRDPAHSPTERVVIRLNSGEVLDSGAVALIRGHAYDPLSAEELWYKFKSCTERTHTEGDAKKLFALLQAIETLPSARTLPTCQTIFLDKPAKTSLAAVGGGGA